jgi:DNA-binding NtrC family response regulator
VAAQLLIVEDDRDLRESLQLVLAAEGYEAHCADGAESALALMTGSRSRWCCAICGCGDGRHGPPAAARTAPAGLDLIMMSAYGTRKLAVEALRRGAYDYLAKPFEPSEVILTMRKAEEASVSGARPALQERDVQAPWGSGRSSPRRAR